MGTTANDVEQTMEKLKIQVRDLQMQNDKLTTDLAESRTLVKNLREKQGQTHDQNNTLAARVEDLNGRLKSQDELVAHLRQRVQDEAASANRQFDQLKELGKTCDSLRAELRDYGPAFKKMSDAAIETLHVLGIKPEPDLTHLGTILRSFELIQASVANHDRMAITGRLIDRARVLVTKFGLNVQFDLSKPPAEFLYNTIACAEDEIRRLNKNNESQLNALADEIRGHAINATGRNLDCRQMDGMQKVSALTAQLKDAVYGQRKTIESQRLTIDENEKRFTELNTKISEQINLVNGLKTELEYEREGWGKLGLAFFNDETKTMEECLVEASRIAAAGRKQKEFFENIEDFAKQLCKAAGDGVNDLGWGVPHTAGNILCSVQATCEALRSYRSTLIKIQCAVKGSTKLKTLDYNCKVGDLDQIVEAVNDCISIDASNARVVARDVKKMIELIENTGMDARRRLSAILPKE